MSVPPHGGSGRGGRVPLCLWVLGILGTPHKYDVMCRWQCLTSDPSIKFIDLWQAQVFNLRHTHFPVRPGHLHAYSGHTWNLSNVFSELSLECFPLGWSMLSSELSLECCGGPVCVGQYVIYKHVYTPTGLRLPTLPRRLERTDSSMFCVNIHV